MFASSNPNPKSVRAGTFALRAMLHMSLYFLDWLKDFLGAELSSSEQMKDLREKGAQVILFDFGNNPQLERLKHDSYFKARINKVFVETIGHEGRADAFIAEEFCAFGRQKEFLVLCFSGERVYRDFHQAVKEMLKKDYNIDPKLKLDFRMYLTVAKNFNADTLASDLNKRLRKTFSVPGFAMKLDKVVLSELNGDAVNHYDLNNPSQNKQLNAGQAVQDNEVKEKPQDSRVVEFSGGAAVEPASRSLYAQLPRNLPFILPRDESDEDKDDDSEDDLVRNVLRSMIQFKMERFPSRPRFFTMRSTYALLALIKINPEFIVWLKEDFLGGSPISRTDQMKKLEEGPHVTLFDFGNNPELDRLKNDPQFIARVMEVFSKTIAKEKRTDQFTIENFDAFGQKKEFLVLRISNECVYRSFHNAVKEMLKRVYNIEPKFNMDFKMHLTIDKDEDAEFLAGILNERLTDRKMSGKSLTITLDKIVLSELHGRNVNYTELNAPAELNPEKAVDRSAEDSSEIGVEEMANSAFGKAASMARH